MSGRKINLLLG